MRYVSIPTVAPVPVDLIVDDVTVEAHGLRYVLLSNFVIRVIDVDSGLDVDNRRAASAEKAAAAFAALIAA